MKLSVVMAVYNERPTIADIIGQVAAPVDMPMEIIAGDDHSTDGTREILATLASQEQRLRVVLQDRRQGKGAAIRKGFECVTGDVVIIQDADLEYDLPTIRRCCGRFSRAVPTLCWATDFTVVLIESCTTSTMSAIVG